MPRIKRKNSTGQPPQSSTDQSGTKSSPKTSKGILHPFPPVLSSTSSPDSTALAMRDDAVKIEGILEDSGFPHAACGAVAMAMHGMPRASVDLDFVVHPSIIDKVRKELRNLGFTYEPGEMTVAKGRIKIHRFVRLVAGKEPDVIDFLLAESGSVCERVLATAIQRDVPGPGGRIFRVLSMPGLMELKSLSDRDQDHADAETLRRRIEFDAE